MSEPLLRICGLSIDLVRDGERTPILDGIDLDVHPGRVLGVLGESGSGKTTLARAMVGWAPPPLHVRGGEVLFGGRDLLTMKVGAKLLARGRIGYVGSDPGSAFDPTLSVGEQIAERLRVLRPDVGKLEARRRVVELLDAVRIPSAKSRYDEFPNQYSGGMLQRAVIVDALIGDPELLICDNIIQPLDVTVAAQIVRLLRELRDRIACAIVFITTSVPSMAEVADEAVVLAGGKIVERGVPDDVARRPQSRAAMQLVQRTPRIWTGAEPPIALAGTDDPILRVDDVAKVYKVATRESFFSHKLVQAVRGVSFDVFPGENFGLVGESGCGKSTLSRLLSWIETPDSGHILFEGTNIGGMTNRERFNMRQRFQLVLQDPYNCIPPHMPVGKSIGVGLAVHGESRRAIADRTREVMAEVGLSPDDAGRLPVGLSAGQRQRVNIARALILEPRLMILDETLSSLDPVEQGRLLDLFERLQARHGLTYLFISHDLAMVRRACTRIAVMYLGKLVEIADTAGLFYNPGHPYTMALLSAVPTLDAKPYRAEDCLLEGEPPNPIDLSPGCSFAARCPKAIAICRRIEPPLVEREPGRFAACHVTAPAASLSLAAA
jgi:peptide/nickel transport system ATP-binding protein